MIKGVNLVARELLCTQLNTLDLSIAFGQNTPVAQILRAPAVTVNE